MKTMITGQDETRVWGAFLDEYGEGIWVYFTEYGSYDFPTINGMTDLERVKKNVWKTLQDNKKKIENKIYEHTDVWQEIAVMLLEQNETKRMVKR